MTDSQIFMFVLIMGWVDLMLIGIGLTQLYASKYVKNIFLKVGVWLGAAFILGISIADLLMLIEELLLL